MPDFSYFTFHLILPFLESLRHILGNYGWAIIVITIVTKVFLLPLSIKQIKSSKKNQEAMAQLKPQFEKLKKQFEDKKTKHAGNSEKLLQLQQEFQKDMLALYQKGGGFNPLSGCLPVLAQFPILIVLYWSFSGPPFQASIMDLELKASNKASVESHDKTAHSNSVNFVGENGRIARFELQSNIPKDKTLRLNQSYDIKLKKLSGDSEITINQDNLFWILNTKSGKNKLHPTKESLLKEQIERHNPVWSKDVIDFEPAQADKFVHNIKALKETDDKFFVQAVLVNTRANQSFGFIKDLGHIGIYDSIAGVIHWDIAFLIVLLVISFWLSSKYASNTAGAMPSVDPNQEKIQKQMQTLLPIVFSLVFIFLPLPAAVFIYFLVSNILQILQSYLINKFSA